MAALKTSLIYITTVIIIITINNNVIEKVLVVSVKP